MFLADFLLPGSGLSDYHHWFLTSGVGPDSFGSVDPDPEVYIIREKQVSS